MESDEDEEEKNRDVDNDVNALSIRIGDRFDIKTTNSRRSLFIANNSAAASVFHSPRLSQRVENTHNFPNE